MATATATPTSKVRKDSPTNSYTPDSAINCVITAKTHLDGIFTSEESVRMDGKLTGDLVCNKKLVLGETGEIIGNIQAVEAVMLGEVRGDMEIKGTLHLKGTAKINGNIRAGQVVVDEGARYTGKCEIGRPA